MRAVLLYAIVIGLCLTAIWKPWIGALAWTWISLMNPHRYVWVADMPAAALVAASTLIGLLITKDKRHLFVTRETACLILLMAWMCIGFPFSFLPEQSFGAWSRVMKVDLMVLVTLALLYTRRHLMLFVWVVTVSVSYFGIKGGLFTIMQGGEHRVYGPPGTFIEDNNELALALVTIIPLMRFLQIYTQHPLLRIGWTMAMLLTAVSAIGSHSRGALLAIAAMAVFFWIRNERKVVTGALIIIAATSIVAIMPTKWETRMETITDYETDASATGRINAWRMAWNLAQDRITGGGFEIYNRTIFQQYAPNPTDVHAAHSIYFQILGEHGFIGLLLFLAIWFFTWRSAGVLYRNGKRIAETKWVSDLGGMCQASLVGYFVGGAFLSLAYFDLPYNIMIMVVLARRILVNKSGDQPASSPVPAQPPNRLPIGTGGLG